MMYSGAGCYNNGSRAIYSGSYSSASQNYSGAGYLGNSSSSAYGASQYNSNSANQHPHEEDHSHASIIIDNFLAENRPITPIISKLGEVKEIVETTYEKMTKQQFPEDSIKIVICSDSDFKNVHASTGSFWSNGIMGFSFNRFGKGVSEIYIKENHLDALLLTIGHEIGHVLSKTLPTPSDEEAKAHAFSIAWMETIRDNNVAGLAPNISLNPAKNGVHDVGYEFVMHLMQTGATAFDVYQTLAFGLTSLIVEG